MTSAEREQSLVEDEPRPRKLFHSSGGGIDFSRLVEQSIPAIVVGAFVIFANAKVTEAQVGDLKDARTLDRAAMQQQQAQLIDLAVKQAGISAQMATFLGQQNTINVALDSRLTFVERGGMFTDRGTMGMGRGK